MTEKTNPLLDAAEYIKDKGWCRNAFLDASGQVCLAGAVGAVTGAILPLTQRELAREFRLHTKEYGYTPEIAEKEMPRFKWSKSPAKLRAYTKALTVLATEIDATEVGLLAEYATDGYEWEPDPKKREEMLAQTVRNRTEGIVIQRNDAWIITEKGKRPRTTKAQAVALLKRAAKNF